MANFVTFLKERGLLVQSNDEAGAEALLASGPCDPQGKRYAIYCGFDPTAESLHMGHLIALLSLRRAQDNGLTPIVLFGGATGLIGDPTGRTEMRGMHTTDQISGFIENFSRLVQRYFRFDVPNAPVFVNNADWIGPMSWLDFARNVAVHFTVARLLSAEVNKTRLEHGLTFMEMGYQLLQSYDFLHLFRTHNCAFQIGGNDQWSNILGGVDLIRKVEGKQAFCLTGPLLVDSSGKKLGKSAGNAIWVDGRLTPPYEFFQYLRNVPDDTVPLCLRMLTLLDNAEIQNIEKDLSNINKVKELLAFEVTRLVHGEEEANKALQAAHALFGGEGDLSAAPRTVVPPSEIEAGLDIVSLLVRTGLAASKGDARRLIQGNGLMVNEKRHSDVAWKPSMADFGHSCGGLLLRKGKKEYHIVQLGS